MSPEAQATGSMYTGSGSVPVPDPTALTAAAVSQSSEQLRREIANLREILEAGITENTHKISALQATFEVQLGQIRDERQRSEIDRKEALATASQVIQNGLNKAELTLQQGLEAAEKRVNEKLTIQNQLLQDTIVRLTSDIDAKVAHLQALHDERFGSVALQFRERDTRSERESRDNKVAVDAAFAAQKEAASEQNKSNTLAIDKSEKATAETLNKQADLFTSRTDALDGRIEDAKQLVSKIDTRLTAIESRGLSVRESQTQSNWLIGAVIGFLALIVSAAGFIVVLVKVG